MDEKIIVYSGGESLEIQLKNNLMADLRDKAIKTTVELLNMENITHIIYIDDKFDIEGQKAEFVGRVKSLKNQQKYINEGSFVEFNWEGPDDLISKLWDESEQKGILLNEVCRFENDDESANVIPTLEITNFFGDKIIPMTPDEWKQNDYALLKGLEGGKRAICLFDFEFQSGNKLIEGRNGAQLAHLLLEQEEIGDKVVCGIFSHKFREDQEDEIRLEYAAQYGIDKAKFYTVSKYRYYFDPLIAGFSEGIKNLLLQPHVEILKQESLDVLKKSNEKAWQRIDDITPKTFNQIIQKSSLKEGVWEVSTLFRLYGILSKEENFNMISDSDIRKKFNSSVERIRLIDNADTGYISKIPNQQLIDLRNSELYLKGELVNKLHLPISNGDIFNIKDKPYILLVQPCNLAIRAKDTECGLRSKNYNNAFLIPLREFSKEQLNHTKQEVFSPTNTSEKVLCAYFPEFKVLSLDYLDLTVFNETGESFINMTIPELDNDVIHFPWKKRYFHIFEKLFVLEEKIKSFIHIKSLINPKIEELSVSIRELTKDFSKLGQEEKAKIIEKLNPIKSEKKDLENHLKSMEESIYSIENFDSFNLNHINNYNEGTRTFSFEIMRERHYKSPYSDDLLQNFMLYLSRNAFEHDFTS